MDDEKKWLLMTYYCPTHGNSGIVRPIELTKKEIRETVLKRANNSKNNYWEHIKSYFFISGITKFIK